MKRVYIFSPAFGAAMSLLAVPVLAYSVGPIVKSSHLYGFIEFPDTPQGQIVFATAAYFAGLAVYTLFRKKSLTKRFLLSTFFLWLGYSLYEVSTIDNQALNQEKIEEADTFNGQTGPNYASQSSNSPPILQGATCGTIAP